MARNTIVLKGTGHFGEGTLEASTTVKPGQLVSLNSAGAYVLFDGATGERDEVVIVVEDALLGKLTTDAYAAGARVFLYWPQPGDELQVLMKSGENSAAIGSKLIAEGSSGKFLKTTSTPESEPFSLLVAPGTLSADTLVLVRATGM